MSRFLIDAGSRLATYTRGAFGCVLVLALLVLPGLVGCQMPTGNSATLDDAVKRLENVTDEMVTKQDLAAAESANAAAHQQLAARVDPLTTKVERDIPAQLGRLTADLNDQRQRSTRIENGTCGRPRIPLARSRRRWSPPHLRDYPEASDSAKPAGAPAVTARCQKLGHRQDREQHDDLAAVGSQRVPLRRCAATNRGCRCAGRQGDYAAHRFRGDQDLVGRAPDYVQRVVIVPTPVLDSVVRYP